ncbi:MAG: hypothetical protein ABI823_18030 [Bryobacteraceae bacterium]
MITLPQMAPRLIRITAFISALAVPAYSHVVSMSTGDLTVDGSVATYELRMPLYEVPQMAQPGATLLGAMHFTGGIGLDVLDGAPVQTFGNEARLVSSSCREADGQLICAGIYEFPAPPSVIQVECRLASVTVANHVHLLRARRGDREDQAVFDLSFQRAELRFEPPTATEKTVRALLTGLWRSIVAPAQWLFLIALVLASRTWRELALLAGMFLFGEAAAQFIPIGALAPRFLEAAGALTIAYLAVEILWLPEAGSRWAVLAALGVVHGLYFAQFSRAFPETRALVLCGVVLGEALALGLVSVGRRVLGRVTQPAAFVLLALGLGWFGFRLFL